jgi:hypothetical protein
MFGGCNYRLASIDAYFRTITQAGAAALDLEFEGLKIAFRVTLRLERLRTLVVEMIAASL